MRFFVHNRIVSISWSDFVEDVDDLRFAITKGTRSVSASYKKTIRAARKIKKKLRAAVPVKRDHKKKIKEGEKPRVDETSKNEECRIKEASYGKVLKFGKRVVKISVQAAMWSDDISKLN